MHPRNWIPWGSLMNGTMHGVFSQNYPLLNIQCCQFLQFFQWFNQTIV